MFKGYVLFLKVKHLRTKLGGTLNILIANLVSLYLLVKSSQARKIDLIETFKHREFNSLDPIVLLCLVMNFIALFSHIIYRAKSPGY